MGPFGDGIWDCGAEPCARTLVLNRVATRLDGFGATVSAGSARLPLRVPARTFFLPSWLLRGCHGGGGAGVSRRASGRGPKLMLIQTVGDSATGGLDALLRREILAGLAANDPGSGFGAGDGNELENRRLELRLGYGFAAFGDRFTSTPELGLGSSMSA